MSGAPPQKSSRGRPRSEQASRAILAAAMDLAVDQGLIAMSMDDVAARAGVGKATIYRWWPSKERLVLDALAAEWATSTSEGHTDTGVLRDDLLARFRPWVRQLNSRPYARVVAGLVAAAQTDGEFADLYREHFVLPRRQATRDLLARARERREIAADTDLEIVLDLLYGPVYHRLLHGHAPLTQRFVERVVDAVLAVIATDSHRRESR